MDSLLLAYNAFHCLESMPPQEVIHIPHLSRLSVWGGKVLFPRCIMFSNHVSMSHHLRVVQEAAERVQMEMDAGLQMG